MRSRALRWLLAFAVVIATGVGIPGGLANPAPVNAAGTTISCSSLYGIDWHNNPHTIWQIDPATGVNTPVLTVNDTNDLNSLAVDQPTNTFWFTEQIPGSSTVTIFSVNAATGAQTTFTAPGFTTSGSLAGAFDPANGLYYYGGLDGTTNTFRLYAFNTVTQTAIGEVADMGFAANSGVNNVSDIAFDSSGHMYFTTDSVFNDQPMRLYVTEQPVPSTPGTGNLLADLVTTSTANQSTSGGLAFGSDGYLYLSQVSGTIQQINPTTGAIVATRSLSTQTGLSDLASCATPNTVQAQKNLPNGRVAAGDQFTMTITGNGVQTTNNQGTTTGTTSGLQNQSPAEVAGPILGLAGLVYTVTETAAGTTNLANYVSTWSCVNTTTGAVLASGTGTTGSFTMPNTGSTGATMMCTFTNVPASPSIKLVKTASTSTPVVGQTVTYTFVATNTGNVPLSNVSIAEGSFSGSGSMSGLTCSPSQPTTLAPGATETCTATYVVTQADVDAGKITNSATATGTPPAGPPVTSTSVVTINPPQSPAMSVVKGVSKVSDVNGDGLTDAGDQIFYQFTVTNTGNVTVANVAVNDPLLTSAGIAVSCPSASLAPGASEVCTAVSGYVITQADVDAGSVSNTATASGTPPGSNTPVVTPPSTTNTPTSNQPGISLVKRFIRAVDTNHDHVVDQGDQLWWTFTVTNTGDVTLHGIAIQDPLLATQGVKVICNPSTLAPGRSVNCVQQKPYIVTAADQARRYVKNVAIGSAIGPHGQVVPSPPSSVVTPIGPLPPSGHPVLPNTGGPPEIALWAATISVMGGLVLMVGGRRRRRA